jgi:Ca2+-binding RTX toxin-like protein
LHDASENATQTLYLVGDKSASSWTVTEDSANTGIDVVDPPSPAAVAGGAPSMTSSSGGQMILVGAGNDILTGHGGGDTFVFKPNMGNDVIKDFHANPSSGHTDAIDLTAFHFANYQALLATAKDGPAGETLDLHGHTLMLDGVHHAEMHASLFLL